MDIVAPGQSPVRFGCSVSEASTSGMVIGVETKTGNFGLSAKPLVGLNANKAKPNPKVRIRMQFFDVFKNKKLHLFIEYPDCTIFSYQRLGSS